MDFQPTENQQMIAEMIRDFGEKNIRPKLMEWDEAQHFPRELFSQMGELGLMGVLVPEQYGGSGLGYHEYITVVSEIAKICGSIGLSVAAHNSLCTNHILEFGNEEQKQKYLPKLASAEHIGAWALTEPNTGSDAMRMKCTATKDGNDWIINGTKCWITHGISGDVVVAIVRTGDLLDSHGMTAFVIERSNPGLKAGKKEDKLGMRASETAEVIFEDCRVPESAMLGKEGEGFIQAMKILDGGRISIASLGIGIAKGAFEASVKYAKEREQFGKPIAHFQGIAFKLADMATEIRAADLMTLYTAWKMDQGTMSDGDAGMAKLFASEMLGRVADEAVQIFGGMGLMDELAIERIWRNARIERIWEGTSEIQRHIISREMLRPLEA